MNEKGKGKEKGNPEREALASYCMAENSFVL